jgi:hypothetical protein
MPAVTARSAAAKALIRSCDGVLGTHNRAAAAAGAGRSRDATLCRPTSALLAAAGFADVELAHYRMRSLFVPVNAQIAGVATA